MELGVASLLKNLEQHKKESIYGPLTTLTYNKNGMKISLTLIQFATSKASLKMEGNKENAMP